MYINKEALLSIVPHRGRMLLLSGVKSYNLNERTIEAECHISEDCLFYDPAVMGVPAWAGFEFIAQAISAFSGIRDLENGVPPKMGFILSVSSMRIELPFFKAGSTVQIKAKEAAHMDLVFNYDGEILLEGKKVLEGKITVMEIVHEQAQAIKKEYNTVE